MRSARAIASFTVVSAPPPTLRTSPAAPRSIAATVASTASATYVKLRDAEPSP
jgi:hypothetical protein